MDDFIKVVKGKARPMAVGGTLISGTLMAGLADAYVKAVNEGEAHTAHRSHVTSTTQSVPMSCLASLAIVLGLL